MAEVKLTKNELRQQQTRLAQLEKYLPTLQLKKAMLQAEVQEVRQTIQRLEEEFVSKRRFVDEFSALLSEKTRLDPTKVTKVKSLHTHFENVAGIEIPYFDSIQFEEIPYDLFETPPWVDPVIKALQDMATKAAHIKVVEQQKRALEHELREVSIRVNLFEKILIPRANENIKKIKVFLGDQQLAAVSQAKAAKAKIETNKRTMEKIYQEQEV